MKKHKIAVIPATESARKWCPKAFECSRPRGRGTASSSSGSISLELRVVTRSTAGLMPEDAWRGFRNYDAIFLGAVGFPGVPDHVSLWGLLIPSAGVPPVRQHPPVR